jgi:hypothetical protein
VLEGLDAGDQVVVVGQNTLVDGTTVQALTPAAADAANAATTASL